MMDSYPAPVPLPPGYSLRPPREEDAKAIFGLGQALLSETRNYLRRPEERAASSADVQTLIRHFRDTDGWVMLHVWQGEGGEAGLPVAEGALTPGGLQRISHVGTLGIGVLKAHWGHGLGRALMMGLEDAARRSGLERLDFTVLADNRRARDFYRRLGYLEEGRRRRSVRFSGADGGTAEGSPRYEDEIAMAKWIGPADAV